MTDTPLERVEPGKCLWSEPIGWIEMFLLFGHSNRPKKPKWHCLIGWKELRHGGCMRVYGYEVMAFSLLPMLGRWEPWRLCLRGPENRLHRDECVSTTWCGFCQPPGTSYHILLLVLYITLVRFPLLRFTLLVPPFSELALFFAQHRPSHNRPLPLL